MAKQIIWLLVTVMLSIVIGGAVGYYFLVHKKPMLVATLTIMHATRGGSVPRPATNLYEHSFPVEIILLNAGIKENKDRLQGASKNEAEKLKQLIAQDETKLKGMQEILERLNKVDLPKKVSP